jgi:hypothetical protein
MDRDAEAAGERDIGSGGGFQHWMAQPYVRPLPASLKKVQDEQATSAFRFKRIFF